MDLSTTEELIDTYVARNWAQMDDGIAFKNCVIDMLFLAYQIAMNAGDFDFADDLRFLIVIALSR